MRRNAIERCERTVVRNTLHTRDTDGIRVRCERVAKRVRKPHCQRSKRVQHRRMERNRRRVGRGFEGNLALSEGGIGYPVDVVL